MVEEPGGRKLEPTLSQTVGPFFHLGLGWLFSGEVAAPGTPGQRISVQGQVLDGDGVPVADALLEVWQADAEGRYAHASSRVDGSVAPGFRGYARVPTDELGAFRIDTVKPGRVATAGAGMQAPHVAVHVFMRGLLRPLVTRVYFSDEVANVDDPVLACVPLRRRASLIAELRPGEAAVFDWNVVLQGPKETVFFDG